ncbi:RDD family protein [uncultured Chitinophaga sp.]|uniref:RDD family protein n=1 Tax=uncultured Chitinophaga sp. TaxID=339340 RepID=UPI0026001870|nr:RDD family protein [uncultured Chitinophaga sp.]
MTSIKIPTAFNIDLEFESADMGKRFWAYIIDVAIRFAYWLILTLLLSWAFGGIEHKMAAFLEYVLVLIPISLYYPVTEFTMKGQSIGKKLMNIKVVGMQGNEPSISQHLIRWLFRLIESPLMILLLFALIGSGAYDLMAFTSLITALIFFMPLIVISRSSLKQRLGDITAGTIVINVKQTHSIQDTIFREISDTGYQPKFTQILRLSDKDLNKVKELLDRSVKHNDHLLAARVAQRIKEVLHIETDMEPMHFIETLLNDYNYLVTRVKG